ncbi:hypothetical protein [uncultured Tateyamaria sp.]|uniref:hypothetical protein n=1 Tax=uncultured Tateyamaria sp. TaxID=455651 RepID=UPI0026131E52|nr:hypothetical protein [uncultured Tateyamaria sp.]
MRDDRNKWPPVRNGEREPLIGCGVQARRIQVQRQTVLSGALDNCLQLINATSAVAGGEDQAVGNTYALRQRRDRVLAVNGPALKDGWHATHGVAVSDMSSAYALIELSGENAVHVIATGTEFVPDQLSASVSRLWHGFGNVLYRHGPDDAYRMHVRSAQFEAVWEMLGRQMTALRGVIPEHAATDQLALAGDDAILPYNKAI